MSLDVSKFQKFQTERIERNKIKLADYNPRTIDKHARKKLKEKIKTGGLIDTLIWNRRTGNLVGGHQRISVLDELEGNQEYALDVAVIDCDLETEKNWNVFLNNPSVQGAYDFASLQLLIDEIGFQEMGFDYAEALMMLETSNDGLFSDQMDAGAETIAALSDIAGKSKGVTSQEEIEKIKAAKKKSRDAARNKDDAEFFIIVVFPSREEVDSCLRLLGSPADCRYVDGQRLVTMLAAERPDKGEAARAQGRVSG